MENKVIEIFKGQINYNLEHDSPKDFVKSQWQVKEKSVVYVIYRWMMACFYLFSFIFSLSTSTARGEFKIHFIYLTNWNMIGSLFTTSLSALLVQCYHKNLLKIDKMTKTLKFFWYLSMTHTLYAAIVSFVYWAILFDKEKNNFINMNNVIIHITNCVILMDIFVVKYKWNIAHFIYPLIFGIFYLAFTFVYPALGGLER